MGEGEGCLVADSDGVGEGPGMEGLWTGAEDRLEAQASAMAATKSIALNGESFGPVSRSMLPFRIRIFDLIVGFATASPTPRRMSDGIMEVKSEPMLYMMQLAFSSAASTRLFAGRVISAPYGLMYQILLIRAGRLSSSSLLNCIAGLRSEGKVPGKLASSTLSCSSVSLRIRVGESRASMGSDAIGADGWLMLFWPVMTLPSESPADMW